MKWRASEEDRQRIAEIWYRTDSLKAVAAQTGRSIPMIKKVLAEAGRRADQEEMPRRWWTDSDGRFCEAMRAAAAAGLEFPPALNVIVDGTPHPPGAHVYAAVPPPRSHTGSSAAWCAQWGDANGGAARR